MKTLNRKGERIPPCLTPQFMGNSEKEEKSGFSMTPWDES
jgi:hypothetical protein